MNESLSSLELQSRAIFLIQGELERRLQKNSHYSLRAYARDLGMSVSMLSCILRSKVPVTKKMFKKFVSVSVEGDSEAQAILIKLSNRRPNQKKSVATEKIDLHLETDSIIREFQKILEKHQSESNPIASEIKIQFIRSEAS